MLHLQFYEFIWCIWYIEYEPANSSSNAIIYDQTVLGGW